MVVRKQHPRRRWGGAALETALVLVPLMSLLLGVFEYGRYMMCWNLINNAAREGCRYALVNNTDGTVASDVQSVVTGFMGGQNSNFTGFTVTVSGTHDGDPTTVTDLAPGDLITVTVSGSFRFLNIIPLVRMPASIGLTSACTMVCEGGT
jgi:Flp pilus assembly protein TadG